MDDIEKNVTEQLESKDILKKDSPRNSDVKSELSEFEKEQQSKGWNPDGPKSAEEWARSEPLYDELKKRGKEIKQLQRTLESMKSVMDKNEEMAYKRALAQLQQDRDNAIALGNVPLVNQIEQQAAALKVKPNAEPEIPQVVQDFKERNDEWLTGTSYKHMKMQDFAMRRDQELASRNLPPDKHMEILEQHIKAEFPDYFTTNEDDEDRLSNNVVDSSGNSGVVSKSKKKYSLKDLTQEQKQCAHDFERLGVMKIDEYISHLVKVGELK